MILILLPRIRKNVKEINASEFQAKKAKKLLQHKGILSTISQKPGENLPTKILNEVIQFY